MWALGLILLVLGLVFAVKLLFWLGIIVLLIGLALYFAPSRRDSRRWYW